MYAAAAVAFEVYLFRVSATKHSIVNKYCNKYYRPMNIFFFCVRAGRPSRFGSNEHVDTDPFQFSMRFSMFTLYLQPKKKKKMFFLVFIFSHFILS